MPRLIDDIRAAGFFTPPFFIRSKRDAWDEHALKLVPIMLDFGLPVILIDNVAEYMYRGSDQEHWDLIKDFPNLAPPFDAFWCEHKMPTLIHSKECGDTDLSYVQRGRVGVLVHSINPKTAKGDGIPENARWILWVELFVDYGQKGRGIEGPHGSIFMCVDEHGVLIERPWMQSLSDPGMDELLKSFMTWMNPTLLSMSFMHCKNVTLVKNDVPKPLAKKYRQKHGVQPTRYQTLIIEPLKNILRTEGRSGEVGLAKAIHICRGHFRDYRQGAGLFGKYHVQVWTPQIVRGTKGTSAPPREIKIKV